MRSRISELVAGGSLEISPREMHRLEEVAALLPKDTCVYIPSLPGLPLSRTLEMVAALRAAGLDPVPHVSARRILDRAEFESFLKEATTKYAVHRVLVIGGDEPKAKGPFNDSLEVLRSGLLGAAGVREIGVSGYPEGHPRIAAPLLEQAFKEKVKLAAEQGLGLYVVTQFSFSPTPWRRPTHASGSAIAAPSRDSAGPTWTASRSPSKAVPSASSRWTPTSAMTRRCCPR
jgi:methylenetetrahydrofolate reductase (NADPH)